MNALKGITLFTTDAGGIAAAFISILFVLVEVFA